ncbi:hypothetical protein L1987_29666 [Smallanthus sonchifolius]|uniref:Uncharacterized protein n=1 Tax=Smallanthus sonchifolius TaxID=185202 RepID=A0ACB9I1U8_9ASTR|nr:hypothetical protein L1987_29666 [Smallanthus sonchifolius]
MRCGRSIYVYKLDHVVDQKSQANQARKCVLPAGWNSTHLDLIPAFPHLSHAVILLCKLREMILKFTSVALLLGILFVWILLKFGGFV